MNTTNESNSKVATPVPTKQEQKSEETISRLSVPYTMQLNQLEQKGDIKDLQYLVSRLFNAAESRDVWSVVASCHDNKANLKRKGCGVAYTKAAAKEEAAQELYIQVGTEISAPFTACTAQEALGQLMEREILDGYKTEDSLENGVFVIKKSVKTMNHQMFSYTGYSTTYEVAEKQAYEGLLDLVSRVSSLLTDDLSKAHLLARYQRCGKAPLTFLSVEGVEEPLSYTCSHTRFCPRVFSASGPRFGRQVWKRTSISPEHAVETAAQTILEGNVGKVEDLKPDKDEGFDDVDLIEESSATYQSKEKSNLGLMKDQPGDFMAPAVSDIPMARDEIVPPFSGNLLDVYKIKSRINNVSWGTSATAGQLLKAFRVCPRTCSPTTAGDPPENFERSSNLSYYSLFKRMWRGGLRFTFEPVATKFHQGQLYMCFLPNGHGLAANQITLENCYNLNGVYVDLASRTDEDDQGGEVETWCLDVPMSANQEMFKTNISADDCTSNSVFPDQKQSEATGPGQILIWVLNPLVAPNVPTTVDINVYINALDDFVMAQPTSIPPGLVVQMRNGEYYDPNIALQSSDREGQMAATEGDISYGPTTKTSVKNAGQETIDPSQMREMVVGQFEWTTSQSMRTTVMSNNFPKDYFNKVKGPQGMAQWFNLLRCDFDIIVKLNGTPFHRGRLLIAAVPPRENQSGDQLYATGFNYPHVVMDAGAKSSKTFTLPYLNVAETWRAHPVDGDDSQLVNGCQIAIHVMNTLQTVSGSNSLTATIIAKPKNVYCGLRQIGNTTLFQSNDCEGSAKPSNNGVDNDQPLNGEETEDVRTVVAKELTEPVQPSSWYGKGHDDLYQMLKRQENCFRKSYSSALGNDGYHRILKGLVTPRNNMLAMMEPFHYYSGTLDYHIYSACGVTNPLMLWSVNKPFPQAEAEDELPTTKDWDSASVAEAISTVSMNNAVQWQPGLNPVQHITVPQMTQFPLLETSPAKDDEVYNIQNSTGLLQLGSMTGDNYTTYGLNLQMTQTAPDVKLYFLRSMPMVRGLIPGPKRATTEGSTLETPELPVTCAAAEGVEFQASEEDGTMSPPRSPAILTLHDDEDGALNGWENLFEPEEDTTEIGGDDTDGQTFKTFVSATMEIVKGLFRTSKEGILTVMEWFSSTKDSIIDSLQKTAFSFLFSGVKNAIKSWYNDHEETIKGLFAVIKTIIGVAYLGRQAYQYLRNAISLTDVVLNCSLMLCSLGTGSITQLKKLFKTRLQSQNDEFLADFVGLLGSISIGMIGQNFSTQSLRTAFTTNCVRTGLTDTLSMIKKGIMSAIDWFWNGPDKTLISKYKKSLEEEEPNVLESMEFMADLAANEENLLLNTDAVAELHKAWNVTRRIQPALDYTGMRPAWSRWCKHVETQWKRYRQGDLMAEARMEPFAIFMYGDSGSGKSTVMSKFIPEMFLTRAGIVPDRTQAKYEYYSIPNDSNQKYMDGYKSQFMVGYDDFLSSKDGKETGQIINFISTATAPVNQADLSDKGQVFTSSLVCVTSNTLNLNVNQNLNNPGALIRRFPFPIQVRSVGPKLNRGALEHDRAQCTTWEEECAVLDRYVQLWRLTPDHENNSFQIDPTFNTPIGFQEFIDTLVRHYKQRRAIHTQADQVSHQISVPVYQGREDEIEEPAKPWKADVSTDKQVFKMIGFEGEYGRNIKTMFEAMIGNQQVTEDSIDVKLHDLTSKSMSPSEVGNMNYTINLYRCKPEQIEMFVETDCFVQSGGKLKAYGVFANYGGPETFKAALTERLRKQSAWRNSEEIRAELARRRGATEDLPDKKQENYENVHDEETFAMPDTTRVEDLKLSDFTSCMQKWGLDYSSPKSGAAYTFLNGLRTLSQEEGDKVVKLMQEHFPRRHLQTKSLLSTIRRAKLCLSENEEWLYAWGLWAMFAKQWCVLDLQYVGNIRPVFMGLDVNSFPIIDGNDSQVDQLSRTLYLKPFDNTVKNFFWTGLIHTAENLPCIFGGLLLLMITWNLCEFVYKMIKGFVEVVLDFFLPRYQGYSSNTRKTGIRFQDKGEGETFFEGNAVVVGTPEDKYFMGIMVDNNHIIYNTHNHEKHGHKRLYIYTRKFPDGVPVTIQHWTFVRPNEDRTVDAVLGRLSCEISGVRSILKRFVQCDDLSSLTQSSPKEGILNAGAEVRWPWEYDEAPKQQPAIFYGMGLLRTKEIDCYMMKAKVMQPTVAGQCGQTYVTKSSNGQDVIVGIHAAGGNFCQAWLAPTPREWIERAMFELDHRTGIERPAVDVNRPEADGTKPPQWQGYSGFDCIGKDGRRNELAMNTDRVHSDLRDEQTWPDGHVPSPKSRAILYDKCQKYGYLKPAKPPTAEEADYVMEEWRVILSKFPNRKTGAVPDYEVLNGRKEDGMSEIQISTSSGMWNKVSSGKKAFFEKIHVGPDDDDYSIVAKEGCDTIRHPDIGLTLNEAIGQRIEKALEGEVPEWSLWTTQLKDELRPIEKAREGKTRVFECPPLDYTLLVRKYMGEMMVFFRNHAGDIFNHGIGMDAEAVWKIYQDILTSKGGSVMTADFSKFDGSIPPAAFTSFKDFVYLFYNPPGEEITEEKRKANLIRAALIAEHQNTNQIALEYILCSSKGNKSGHPFTDGFNSYVNKWAWMICFYRLFKKKFGSAPSVANFHDFLALLTYGDDCAAGTAPENDDWLNGKAISDEMDDLGFFITSATKDGDLESTGIKEASYLKRNFRDDGLVVWGPMPKETSYKELNWIRKRCKRDTSVKVCMLRDSMRFMAHHGREEYMKLWTQVLQRLPHDPPLHAHGPLFDSFEKIQQDVWMKQKYLALSPKAFVRLNYRQFMTMQPDNWTDYDPMLREIWQ